MSEDPVARQTAAKALNYVQQSLEAFSNGIVVSAAYSASSGQVIDADTSVAGFTLTLPASGGTVVVRDHAGTWGTNPLTVAGNGSLIAGQSTFLLNVPGFQVTFTLINGAWRYVLLFLNGAT